MLADCLRLALSARKESCPVACPRERLVTFDKRFPLVPHTNAGRLSSVVRRMKAEQELGIPICRRTGFAISTEAGKAANEMTVSEWARFYSLLCAELERSYPDIHSQ